VFGAVTDDRFDDLTRRLESATSRRGVLKGAVAVALGGVAMRLRGSGSASARARIKIACAREGMACSTLPGAGGSLTCCPHLVCDEATSVCAAPIEMCAPGVPAESCLDQVISPCGPNGICANTRTVEGGCVCTAIICGPTCTTSADCQSGVCVDVPECCGPLGTYFCAPPCIEVLPGSVESSGAPRARALGRWRR
jgi:hypothetical protein